MALQLILHNFFFSFFVFQYLRDVNLYESQEEAVSREEVLGRLDQVLSLSSTLSFILLCLWLAEWSKYP